MMSHLKSLANYSRLDDSRKSFCEWYNTPVGNMLREREAEFLTRSINVRYNQLILQVGWLGWEDLFLDDEQYRDFNVVDHQPSSHSGTSGVIANIQQLPIASESVDVVIMPHSLEFESDQHQVLREAERVLRPEGQLLLLGFNPWSTYRAYHFLSGKRNQPPWNGHFIGRRRILDWLSLLNFETEGSAGFYLKSSQMISEMFEGKISTYFSIAYAIKAIKRRYTLIPLKPAWLSNRRLFPVEVIETTSARNFKAANEQSSQYLYRRGVPR